MRTAAAIFLVSAAIDWPALLLDRAGVALIGLAFLALALPAAGRPKAKLVERPRPPAIFDEDAELERDLAAAARAAGNYLDAARSTA